MNQVETNEQRREARLRYSWPVWYAETLSDMLAQGQMVDVSSQGAAFTCYADRCPKDGDKVTTRFSVPTCDASDPFDLESFVREGSVCRVEELSPFVRKVAMQFAEPLPFNPADAPKDGLLDEELETI
ncbi:PilZ domain protein [Anaerohalosphaera lusitana]|uniref:PilZ domain protein n=1 Tax=Anaerohalosphaera lusitana TaxID=1936003 RepID=A0A1U9NI95_9BACT|nr:hypothetical protein [Anaerohalosphaera lusitana]AQT67649.1 PilZ domain protein [Anaerohalosphaera lusitana]